MIQITMEDYGFILKAYVVAVTLLAFQYPEPTRGRDSEYKKRKRKENEKLAIEFNKSHERFLKTCRETMKEVIN